MPTIFDVKVATRKGELAISLNYEESAWSATEPAFTLRVAIGDKHTTAEFKAKFDDGVKSPDATVSPSVNATFSITTDPLAMCLLGCVGSALVKPLIECFNRDIQKYLECLKSKGLSIAADAVSCAIGCLDKA